MDTTISTKDFNALRAAALKPRLIGDLPATITDAEADDELTAKARRERAKAIAAEPRLPGQLNQRERALLSALKAAQLDVREMTLSYSGGSYQHRRAIVARHLVGAA
jgi:hypothetical protein